METMNSLGRNIFGLLAKDSEPSLQDKATKPDFLSSTWHQKIERLETRRAITAYQARLDLQSVGLKTNDLVSLTLIAPVAPDNVPEQPESIAEIEGCCSVAGTQVHLVAVPVAEPVDLEAPLAGIRAAANVRNETKVFFSTALRNRPSKLPN